MLQVNPADLEVAANVRHDVGLTKEFVRSVKTHGVLVPLIVTPGLQDGRLAVIDGQRRALAAVEAGLAEVPVVVVDHPADSGQRIVTQVVVNDQRAGLTQADAVAAVRELALFGMSPTAIGRNLGEKKADVDVALRVGASETAVAAMRDHAVTLADAALLVEFEDNPEALADLTAKAEEGYGGLEHTAQSWRDHAASLKVAVELDAAEGIEAIDDAAAARVNPLRVTQLFTDEECTVALTDAEAIERFAGAGLCGFPQSSWQQDGSRSWGVGYAVRDWEEKGLFTHPWVTASLRDSTPATPEEIEAARVERRVSRETTKAWKSATVVRVAWLRKLLSRRVMPKGWDLFVAHHLLSDVAGYSSSEWDAVVTLLGLEPGEGMASRRDVVRSYLVGAPHRSQAVVLAFALGAMEGGFEFAGKGWRQGDRTAKYLTLLHGWGYDLSDVEAEVLS